MGYRKIYLGPLLLVLLSVSVEADVRVFVEDTNGIALIKYQCTAGEIIRAFALDVSVDRGAIVGISGFFRGISNSRATGYGIFPAALRGRLQTNSTNIDWSAADYTPLANPKDDPSGTLSGLGSTGVTLEFGGLWDPTMFSTIPRAAGTLCALRLSRPANVSVSANKSRGGVVSAISGITIHTSFAGARVGWPAKKRHFSQHLRIP